MGQQTIPILKDKFADGRTPTGSDFGDIFDSYIHKSSRLPQSQILGLDDALADKASMKDLANVVSGLNPMGEAQNLQDLETKTKRNNDAYFVLDQLDENGDPYIFRYDAELDEWINTKQVVFKDVAKKTDLQSLEENTSEKIAQLVSETDEKLTQLKENISSLSIACFYDTIADMEADNSPVNQNTGQPLLVGELAAISNPEDNSDPDNGKIFACTGTGWRYMGHLESITEMQFTDNYFDII